MYPLVDVIKAMDYPYKYLLLEMLIRLSSKFNNKYIAPPELFEPLLLDYITADI
jgi:hypothetical protein